MLQSPVAQDARWRVAEAAAVVPHLVEDILKAVRHIQQVPCLGIYEDMATCMNSFVANHSCGAACVQPAAQGSVPYRNGLCAGWIAM